MSGWERQAVDGGRYSVHRLLGQGGYGEVYLAHDLRMDRDVVLKVPRRALLDGPGFAERFRREIRALVNLSHPCVTRVLDQGSHDSVPFAVLEYMGGGTLEDRLRSNSQRTAHNPESLHSWLPRIAEALDYIHSKGYVHRDVKPANIIFNDHGHAYLADFGIAKLVAESVADTTRDKSLTGTGLAMGTVDYMAPELCDGSAVDEKVDQYALAVTVFQILAGRCPFEGRTPLATLVKHKTEQAPLLHSLIASTPLTLSESIDRALQKRPLDRYQSCGRFANSVLADVHIKLPEPVGAAASPIAGGAQRLSLVDSRSLVKITCPTCRKALEAPAKAVGKSVKCPRCETIFSVPAGSGTGRIDICATTPPVAGSHEISPPTSSPPSQLDKEGVASNTQANGGRVSSHSTYERGATHQVAQVLRHSKWHLALLAVLVGTCLTGGVAIVAIPRFFGKSNNPSVALAQTSPIVHQPTLKPAIDNSPSAQKSPQSADSSPVPMVVEDPPSKVTSTPKLLESLPAAEQRKHEQWSSTKELSYFYYANYIVQWDHARSQYLWYNEMRGIVNGLRLSPDNSKVAYVTPNSIVMLQAVDGTELWQAGNSDGTGYSPFANGIFTTESTIIVSKENGQKNEFRVDTGKRFFGSK